MKKIEIESFLSSKIIIEAYPFEGSNIQYKYAFPFKISFGEGLVEIGVVPNVYIEDLRHVEESLINRLFNHSISYVETHLMQLHSLNTFTLSEFNSEKDSTKHESNKYTKTIEISNQLYFDLKEQINKRLEIEAKFNLSKEYLINLQYLDVCNEYTAESVKKSFEVLRECLSVWNSVCQIKNILTPVQNVFYNEKAGYKEIEGAQIELNKIQLRTLYHSSPVLPQNIKFVYED